MPVRVALVAVAAAQLALAIPGLVYGTDEGAPIHVAHEAGSWSLALAVGFLFAAWRPLRAVGMLPFVGALAAGLLFTAGLDLAHGKALALDESSHLLELIGTGLLWLLVHPRAPGAGTRPRACAALVSHGNFSGRSVDPSTNDHANKGDLHRAPYRSRSCRRRVTTACRGIACPRARGDLTTQCTQRQ